MKKRIGILGGTFNPVHEGHISIARSFLKSNLIHRLLITPALIPPHKTGKPSVSFFHRFEMLNIAFRHDEKIIISDVEENLPAPSYTINTLEYLQKKHPDTLFYLCMGEDSLAGFASWYKYDRLLGKTILLVAERPGVDRLDIKNEIRENSIYVEHQPIDISSTKIRTNELNMAQLRKMKWIPDEVVSYIDKHHLYPENKND